MQAQISSGTYAGSGTAWSTAAWLPGGTPGSGATFDEAEFGDAIGGLETSKRFLVDGLFNLGKLNVTAGLKQTLTLADGGVAGRGFHFGGADAGISLLSDASLIVDSNVFFDAPATIRSVQGTLAFNAGKTFSIGDNDLTVNAELIGGGVHLLTDITGGAASLTKMGAGELRLGGANTFSGGVNLYGGRLLIDNDRALGTGALTIGDGSNPSEVVTLALAGSRNIDNQLIWNNDLSVVNAGVSTVKTLSFDYEGEVELSDVRKLELSDYVSVRMGDGLALTGAGGLYIYGNVTGGAEFRNARSTFSGGYKQGLKHATAGTGSNSITLGALDDGHNYIGSGDVTVSGTYFTLTLNPGGQYATNLRGRVTLDWGAILDLASGSAVLDGAILADNDPERENRFVFRGDTVFTGVTFENDPALYFTAAAGRTLTLSGAGMGAALGKLIIDGQGAVALAADAANIGAAQILLESGTLALGADNQIRAGSALFLGDSVELRAEGYSAAFTGGLAWGGAARVIDLGGGASTLEFGADSAGGNGMVYVRNWDEGADHLLFSDDISTASWRNNLRFEGYNWGMGVQVDGVGAQYEVIPTLGAMAGSGTYEWTGSASFSTGASSNNMWNAPGNWDINRIPEFGAGTTMVFGNKYSSYSPNLSLSTIGGTVAVGTLLFSRGASSYNAAVISSGTLIMDSGDPDVAAQIRKANYNASTISSAIRLDSDLILDRADTLASTYSYTGTLSGKISDRAGGSSSITITGGHWHLSNSGNDFTGGVTLEGGALRLSYSGSNNAIGKGALTIKGGVLQGGNIYNKVIFDGDFCISGSTSGAGATTFYASGNAANNIIELAKHITITGTTGSQGWGGYNYMSFREGRDLQGDGGLSIAGSWASLQTYANNSNFSGGYTQRAGTMQVYANSGSATGNVIYGEPSARENYLGIGSVTVNEGSITHNLRSAASFIEFRNNVTLSLLKGTFTNSTAGAETRLASMTLIGSGSRTTGILSINGDLIVGSVAVSDYPNITMTGGHNMKAGSGTAELAGLGRFSKNTTLTTSTIAPSITRLGMEELYINAGRLTLTRDDQVVMPATGTVALGATAIINTDGAKNTLGTLAINGASTFELGTGGELAFGGLSSWGNSGGILHLLNIQNISGAWNTTGNFTLGNEHVWLTSTASFTQAMLDSISFTGYTRGAGLAYHDGKNELVASGEKGFEWSGGSGDNFSTTSANWFGGAAPGTAGDIAIFRDADPSIKGKTIQLNENRTLGKIYIEATTGADFTIAGAGERNLIFDNNGSQSVLYFGGASVPTISANIVLADAGLLIDHQAYGRTLTLSDAISGAGGIRFTVDPATLNSSANQNYYLTLSGNNTFSGGVEQQGGRLYINSDHALGTGTYTVTGTATIYTNNSARTLENPLLLDGGIQVSGNSTSYNLTFKNNTGLITSGTKNIYIGSSIGQFIFDSDYVLSGPGALSVHASSVPSYYYQLVMRGQNTFSGGVTLNSGAIKIGASSLAEDGHMVSGPLGTGTYTFSNGSTFIEDASQHYTIHNPLSLGAYSNAYLGYYLSTSLLAGSLTFDSIEDLKLRSGANTFYPMGVRVEFKNSITNPDTGAGSITLAMHTNTPAFLRLSGSNGFTGGVTVNSSYGNSTAYQPTLSIANDAALGAGRLTLSGYHITLEAYGADRDIENPAYFNNGAYTTSFTAAGGAQSLTFSGTGNSTITSGTKNWNIADGMTVTFGAAHNLTGASAALVKQGGGELQLLSPRSTFNGLTINAGAVSTTLLPGSDMVLGASGTGAQDSYFGTGTLTISGNGAVALINTWADAGDTGDVIVKGALSVTNGGLLDIRGGGNLVFAYTGDVATGGASTSGSISIGDGGWLVKDGPGTTTTLNASIAAPILIRGGTLSLANTGLLSNAGSLVMTGSGALMLNGLNQTLGGDWSLTAASTLDFGNKGYPVESTVFTVAGFGDWDLNSTLRVTNWYGALAVGGGNSQIIINDYAGSAQFIPNVWFAGYGPGAYIQRRDDNVIELVPYATTYKWVGGTDSIWSLQENWVDFAMPNTIGVSVSFGDAASTTKPSGTSINLDSDKRIGSLVFEGTRGQRFNFTGAGSIIFDIAGEEKAKGVVSQIVMAEDNHATINAPVELDVDLLVNNLAGSSLEITGQVYNAGGYYKLVKRGAGTLTLSSADNNYDGGTFLEGGLLRINAPETLNDQGYVTKGPIGAGEFTISGGAIEAFNAGRTISNRIILDGDFTVSGANTLTFAYDSTAIPGAQKSIINSASAAINVADAAGRLVITATNTLAGTGMLIKDGAGTLELQGAHEYTGGTEIRQGTLAISNALSMSTQDAAFTGDSTLRLDTAALDIANAIDIHPGVTGTINTQTHTGTLSGIITGDGGLAKAGTGTLTLTSSNSRTGNTSIDAGALIATDAGALSTGAVNVAASAKAELVFNNATVANTFTGAGETVVTGTALRLTADNTGFTGTWTVDGSALASSPANLGANSAVIISGTLTADGSDDFTFASKLGGAGVLNLNATGANRFGPAAGTYVPGFTGRVNANAGTLFWDANANAVLASATLALNGGLLDITTGLQTSLGLTVSGGTMAFTGTAGVTDFAITGSANIVFDHAVMQTAPLLQQDEGSGRAYVIAQNWDGDISNLHLITAAGDRIDISSTLAIGADTEAYGIYSNTLTSSGGTLGVAYRLTELQLQADKTLILAGDTTPPPGGDDMTAKITGAGNLDIAATDAITLSSTGNTYTGATTVSSGTLILAAADAIASSTAVTVNAALADASGTQTLNNLRGATTGLISGDSTLYILHSTVDTAYDGIITGQADIQKTGDATLTLSASNAYTGTTSIAEGALRLADLGATGTGNILNDAILDLAATGTFANNIAGSGTTVVSAGAYATPVVLTGANQTSWHITGAAEAARQDNLGDGSVNLDHGSLILSATAWRFTNMLTGDGTLIANFSPSTGTFAFAASAAHPAAFTGTLDMRSGFFQLDAASAAASTGIMRAATLVLGADGSTLLDSGAYYLGGLRFDGGSLKVNMRDSTKPEGMLTVGDLSAPDTGKVELSDWSTVGRTPALPDGTDFFYHDSGTIFEQLVHATGNIDNAGSHLDLYDFDGNLISDPTLKQIHEQGGGVSGTALYDYGAEVVDDGSRKGLYLAYMLRELSANSGTSITLDNTNTSDATNTLTAKLTGEGGFIMNGTGVYYIGSAASDYTGTTAVATGTLALYANKALGNTAQLDIAANAGLDLNGKTQTIGALDNNGALHFNAGTLIIAGATGPSASHGSLTGAGALVIQDDTLTVHGANTALAASASINPAATLALDHAQGFGSGAITADGELVFLAAAGANANTIAGSGLVTATNAANITLAGNNAAFTGTWQIASASAFKATAAESLGAGQIANSGTLIVGASLAAPSANHALNAANTITGAGLLVKEDANTVTLAHANDYTGGSIITGGTLRIEDLGALGTGGILNDASLDLAATGIFANNISGSGTTHVTAGSPADYTILAGSNQTAWRITGAAQATRQQNLGDGPVHIDRGGELSLLDMGGDYTFGNALTGSGTLAIDTTGDISFAAATGADFTGAAILRNNRLALGAANTLALTQATLVIAENNRTTVAAGEQRIGNLTLASGTLSFNPSQDSLVRTNTLALADTVIMIDAVSMSADDLALLQHDEGKNIQLISSSTLAQGSKTIITGSQLVDQDGNEFEGASSRDITRSGQTVASGTYNFAATADNTGLYLAYVLTHLELFAGQTTTLDRDISSSILRGADELHALISGAGNLEINAGGIIYLNNGDNTYTGATLVTGGILVAGNSGALGNTSLLSIAPAAAADLNGTAQTIGALDNNGSLHFSDGTLTIHNGGTSTGSLTGEGALNLETGNLLVTDANPSLALATNIAASATATLNHASALGDSGDILIDGLLALDIESPAAQTLAPSLAGSGLLLKTNSGAVTIPAANPAFAGSASVKNGRLTLENLAALAAAPIDVDAPATLEYRNIDGVLANTVSGSGTLHIAHSELAIAHDNTIANTTLENALVRISATQALGPDTAAIRAGANSAILLALDGARLGHVTLDSARLGFAHDTPAFHRATLASLDGSTATLIFNTDFTDVSGLKQPGEVSDHLAITDGSAGAFTVHVNPLGGLPTSDETAIPLITDANGSALYQLDSGKLEFGLTEYSLGNGASAESSLALDPRTWYLYTSGLSQVVDVIIDTAALLAKDWHYSLDALYLRMGDLRNENLSNPRDPQSENSNPKTGNVWVRSRAYQLNAANPITGRSMRQYAYGVSAGGDKAFGTQSGVNLLGAFLDMGRITRNFGASSNSKTNSLSAGLYATLLKNNGWHADFVIKADRYRHNLDVSTVTGRPVRGSYTTLAYGASIELGRRLERADGWWVEPAVQAARVWLDGARYRTTPDNAAIDVKVDDTAAAQYRGLVRFGRRLKDTRWTPYGKFGLAKTDTDGGAIHAHNSDFEPDFDSWRVEFGAGTSYRIDAASQVYFDYEYGKAAAYERPWSLNLGYRRLW